MSDYKKAAEGVGKASDCINCKQCERACPQQINITEILYGTEAFTYSEKSYGDPYDCIECGFCTLCCHMGIDVMEIIRGIAMEQCISCEIK